MSSPLSWFDTLFRHDGHDDQDLDDFESVQMMSLDMLEVSDGNSSWLSSFEARRLAEEDAARLNSEVTDG